MLPTSLRKEIELPVTPVPGHSSCGHIHGLLPSTGSINPVSYVAVPGTYVGMVCCTLIRLLGITGSFDDMIHQSECFTFVGFYNKDYTVYKLPIRNQSILSR